MDAVLSLARKRRLTAVVSGRRRTANAWYKNRWNKIASDSMCLPFLIISTLVTHVLILEGLKAELD